MSPWEDDDSSWFAFLFLNYLAFIIVLTYTAFEIAHSVYKSPIQKCNELNLF